MGLTVCPINALHAQAMYPSCRGMPIMHRFAWFLFAHIFTEKDSDDFSSDFSLTNKGVDCL